MTVAITRTQLDAAGLRSAAGRSKDAAAARRMLALALVMEGHSRSKGFGANSRHERTLPAAPCRLQVPSTAFQAAGAAPP